MRNNRLLLALVLCFLAAAPLGSTSADEQPAKRFLIIHGDDAGMSHSANRGTIDAMEQGIVSSASIMVPCPWFLEIAEYAKNHPERDFGVHLTLTCEWKQYRWGPVASRDKVPSLLDPEGYLWSSSGDVAKHAKVDEVEMELRAQIDRAKQFGVPISHLDTHMGSVLGRADLAQVYVKLGIEYNLPILFVRKMDPELIKDYPDLAVAGKAVVKLLDSHHLPVLDQLAQFYGDQPDKTRREAYLESLRDLQPGVSQLIIHCGYDNAELQGITNSSARRDEDRRVFSDPEVIKFIKQQGIEVISWKQFRQLHSH